LGTAEIDDTPGNVYSIGSQPGCRGTLEHPDSFRGAESYFLVTFRPILASSDSAKYWYSTSRAPKGKKRFRSHYLI